MAKFKFLLDNDVRHLAEVLPAKQTAHLEGVGLNAASTDEEIVQAASTRNLLIVTNNRRDFQQAVVNWIGESTKKADGCTQVHGLVIIKPSEALNQSRLFLLAAKKLDFEGKRIGWKTVFDECLQVVIEASGAVKITKLPRCPFCPVFAEAKVS
jgi:Domain of unknown function (DUF5615)